MLAILAAVACTARLPDEAGKPAGFSADTFTGDGLATGAAASEAACHALGDGLWVVAAGRQECLRYAAAGLDAESGTALLYLPGDPAGAAYRYRDGEVSVELSGRQYELSPAATRHIAEALSAGLRGMPVILLGRPGMHGSTGHHAQDRHSRMEVLLVNAALDALRSRHGVMRFAVVGFSSGGTIAANLLAQRDDIVCAALASAPLDLAAYYRAGDGGDPGMAYYALRRAALADPMRNLAALRAQAIVFVIGDPRDRSVPVVAWRAWVREARHRGVRVLDIETALPGAADESFHRSSSLALEAAAACAAGEAPERIQSALLAGAPLVVPRGRRLTGGEIAAAFAGRRMFGVTWYPRDNLSVLWGAEGRLQLFDLHRGDQAIADGRWWVEGDTLCTVRDGCREVRADGRFLHLTTGQPPRLRATFTPFGSGP